MMAWKMKVEDNRALDSPRIMNEENQSQPVYEKLDAGKMAEPLDAGGRILPEGLEAQVENAVIGRDDRFRPGTIPPEG